MSLSMSLANRSLNTGRGGGSPVKAGRLSAVIGGEENSAENASAVGGDDGGSISAAGRTPSSENIKVAVRLKPLSVNPAGGESDEDSYDDGEIDGGLGSSRCIRAWRVVPETNTIVQEGAASSLGAPMKLGGAGASVAISGTGLQGGGAGDGATFTFDRVFGEDSTSAAIYDDVVRDVVQSVAQKGIDGTVFAYGQTSSGKTHTMQGSRGGGGKSGGGGDAAGGDIDGIVQMSARDVFATIASDPEHSFAIRISFLEIYNEEVRDLLVAGGDRVGGIGSNRTLPVREDSNGKVFVEGLTVHRVFNLDTLLHYLKMGEKHKAIAATGMNDRSSRSHTIFCITVERSTKPLPRTPVKTPVKAPAKTPTKTPGKTPTRMVRTRMQTRSAKKKAARDVTEAPAAAVSTSGDGFKLVATLNLVDLAGSESVRHTGATGNRRKEGGKINQSLLALSRVVMGLGQGKGKGYINYRDSKLTRILQNSLSGKARMSVICCATLDAEYTEETKSTLQFASRAKLVKTRAKANVVHEDPSLIKKLQREIAQRSEEGKQALRQLRILEQSAKEAEKTATDANEKLKKLHDFVRGPEAASLVPREGEYGVVLSTKSCGNGLAAPKKRFSERLFVHTALGGSRAVIKDEKRTNGSKLISPRYADIVSSYEQSAAQIALLRDALAAKGTQVQNLKISQSTDAESVVALKREKETMDEKIRGLATEKKDALDWIEELYSQADVKDKQIKVVEFEKDEALAEVEQLREEVKRLQDMQVKNADNNEKAAVDIGAMYQEKNAELRRESEDAKRQIYQKEGELIAMQTQKEEALSRLEISIAAKDEVNESLKELLKEKNTLLENLDDLSVENQQALQIIEELTNEKEHLSSEISEMSKKTGEVGEGAEKHSLRTENESLKEINAKLELECDRMTAEIEEILQVVKDLTVEKDKLEGRLEKIGHGNTESTDIIKIVAKMDHATESKEELVGECRRMTCENDDLKDQLQHLNSSLKCHRDVAESTEKELNAEVQDLRNEIVQVSDTAEKAKEEASAARNKVNELSYALSKAKEDVNEAASKEKAFVERASALAQTVKNLESQIELKTEERNIAIAALEAANKSNKMIIMEKGSLLQKIDGMTASIHRQRGEHVDSMECDRDSQAKKVKELEEKRQLLVDAKSSLEARVEYHERETMQLRGRISSLQLERNTARQELTVATEAQEKVVADNSKLRQKLGALEHKKNQLSVELEEVSAALALQKDRTAEKERAESDWKKRLSVSSIENSDFKCHVKAMEYRISELSTELASRNRLYDEVKADNERAANAVLTAEKQVFEMVASKEHLSQRADELASALVDANEEMTRLKAESSKISDDLSEKTAQNERLRNDLRIAQKTTSDGTRLQTELQKNQAEIRRLSRELAAKESEVKFVKSRAARLESNREDAPMVAKVGEDSRREDTIRTGELVTDLSEKLLQTNREKAELERRLAEAENSKKRLMDEKSNAERSAKRVRRESTTAQLKLQQLRGDLNSLSREKEELEDRVRQLNMLVEETDIEVQNIRGSGNDFFQDQSTRTLSLAEEKSGAKKRIATLEQQLADMAGEMDFLEASKVSAERTAARLLEQKNRALIRLDRTTDKETEAKRQLLIEKARTERQRSELTQEKENAVNFFDTKLAMYEQERNSLGKLTKRSVRVFGKTLNRGAAKVSHQIDHQVKEIIRSQHKAASSSEQESRVRKGFKRRYEI